MVREMMWMSAGNRCLSPNSEVSSNYSNFGDEDDDAVDPRVQEELEKLNNATDAINKLEVDLDDARAAFRQLLTDSSQRLNGLVKKLGSCVEKSRPYYEAKIKEKKGHAETQKAALRFERANSAHAIAKEMVFSAEERLQKAGCTFDPAWQEMLNHATIRVNEAERERNSSEQEHKKTSKIYNESEQMVKTLKKELRSSITKASLSARRSLLQLNDLAHQHQLLLLPYFEMKAQFNKKMEEKKRQVEELEENVLKSKLRYAEALHSLEEISDEIHKKRKANEERRALGARGSGVGAENPEPANSWEKSDPPDNKKFNGETIDKSGDWQANTPIQRSRSSSTLIQPSKILEEDEDETQYMNRLRKSKSVMERTRAGPLFGRYSVSRNNKLQVDHACQTEEMSVKPQSNEQCKALETNLRNLPDSINLNIRENLLNISADGASSILKISSEESSPVSTGSFKPVGVNTEQLFSKLGQEYDPSDSESQFSGDGLSDDQIASLMLDMELEVAAQAITEAETTTKMSASNGMHNQTTQTASIMDNRHTLS
ncbi:hypothetical protein CHUAL_000946 [Chamberlinius hualienensis]